MSAEKDDMIMPFGKYKGQLVSDVPHKYLLYLYDRKKFSGKLKNSVEDAVPILNYLKEKKTK